MPSNTDKRHCSVTGCKAWAIHGTDPPLCSPHARRGGAPPGNANRLLHGLSAASPHPEEEPGDPDQAVATSLDGEIRETRAIYHRLVQMIATGVTPGPDPQSLTATEYIRLIGLRPSRGRRLPARGAPSRC